MEKGVLSKDELPPHKRSHSPAPEEKSNASEPSSASEDPEAESVHSANNWEGVELGDEQRKAKFLRLMGAAKKEHKGRFVIGSAVTSKPHGRSDEEERSLEEKLETQYQHSMSDAVHHRHKKHRGLGFDDDDTAAANEDEKKQGEKPPAEETDRSPDKK